MEQHPEKIDWQRLSGNPNAIPLLEQHPEKIDWFSLSRNPNAIHLLEQHPEKIDWSWLLGNPNAISLLEKRPEKIDWLALSGNPNIFTYDYEAMRDRCLIFKEDLMKNRFHPRNLGKFRDWGIDGFEDEDDTDFD